MLPMVTQGNILSFVATKEDAIPEMLERLRAKGWSDKGIGDALGIDRVIVYRWRKGRRLGRIPTILRLALKTLERRKVPA